MLELEAHYAACVKSNFKCQGLNSTEKKCFSFCLKTSLRFYFDSVLISIGFIDSMWILLGFMVSRSILVDFDQNRVGIHENRLPRR